MDSSILSRIPTELRLHIFELALQHHESIVIKWGHGVGEIEMSRTIGRVKNATSLLKVCRQAHAESIKPLYALNIFEFRNGNKYSRNDQEEGGIVYAFLQLIGPANARYLRKIVVKMKRAMDEPCPYYVLQEIPEELGILEREARKLLLEELRCMVHCDMGPCGSLVLELDLLGFRAKGIRAMEGVCKEQRPIEIVTRTRKSLRRFEEWEELESLV